MKKYILALDEGTTSARAILFDQGGTAVCSAQNEFPLYYPHPGWVEQDPMEIYAAQMAALTECVAKSGVSPAEIAAIGITNQRETTVVWNRETGEPIAPAIVWQCRRTAPLCERLDAEGYGDEVRQRTGLRLDPYFSATKVAWILENTEGARALAGAGKLAFGTVDTWLIYTMTEGRVFVTDRTHASRTMLYNIHTGDWDDALLTLFGVPRSMLPSVKSSSEVYGSFAYMGTEIPIAGIAGDQQAALFGQGCFSSGEAKYTYGTGCFLLAHTGERAVESQAGLLTTVCATQKDAPVEYALEGSVFVGGALIGWLRDEMRLLYESSDSEYYARKVADSGGVYVVPAFTGLGAPYWNMHARGSIFGLTRGVGKNHIIRASLEAIAYQTEDVLHAMRADMKRSLGEGADINSLRVDGGASRNDLLMQIQSDISALPVARAENTEATALGAAFLAGLAVGFYPSRAALRSLLGEGKTFLPNMTEAERAHRLDGWHRAVRACECFAKGEE